MDLKICQFLNRFRPSLDATVKDANKLNQSKQIKSNQQSNKYNYNLTDTDVDPDSKIEFYGKQFKRLQFYLSIKIAKNFFYILKRF